MSHQTQTRSDPRKSGALASLEELALNHAQVTCLALEWDGMRVAVLGNAPPGTGQPRLDGQADVHGVSCEIQGEDGATLGKLWGPLGGAPDPERLREAAASRSGYVDIRVLKQLVGDEPEVVADFLNEFRHGATFLMHSLHAVVWTDAWRDARGIAHRLKSSARSVGAGCMGDLCEQMEDLTGNPGAGQRPVSALQAELEKEWLLVCEEITHCMSHLK